MKQKTRYIGKITAINIVKYIDETSHLKGTWGNINADYVIAKINLLSRKDGTLSSTDLGHWLKNRFIGYDTGFPNSSLHMTMGMVRHLAREYQNTES